MEEYLGHPGGSNVLTGSLSMKEKGRRVSVRVTGMRNTLPATSGFEDRARGPWKLGKARERVLF